MTRVHQAYVKAGADIITTNSYAIVPFHLGEGRFAERGAELAALSGQLARAVVDGDEEEERTAATASSPSDAPLSQPTAATTSTAKTKKRKVLVAGSLPPTCGSYRAEWFNPDLARPILSTLVGALRPYIDLWLAET